VQKDEWKQLRATLRERGIEGADDLGRFVSNLEHLSASSFDERSAMPVLLEVLPQLSDPQLVTAVAGHLRRPWARPAAFEPLRAAFLHWAPIDQLVGWSLGDALASAATVDEVEILVDICGNPSLGTARQMVVYSLRRYKTPRVATTLTGLVDDPAVGLHAMSALRSVIGNAGAVPVLERVAARRGGTSLGEAAARELRKARKALAG
jgi:hypothetical protein